MKKASKNDKRVVERLTPGEKQEWLTTMYVSIYNTIAPYIRGKRILDAGCGCGIGGVIWSENGAKEIYAYDISDEAIRIAKKIALDNMVFFKNDFNKEDFGRERFDIAISIEVIEHLKEYEFYLHNLYKALKKGGTLFISTPNKKLSDGINPYHIKEFCYDELIELLTNIGFSVVKSVGFENNKMANMVGKYTPPILLQLAKRIPFYSSFVRTFFQPKIQSAQESFTMLFICKK